MTMLPLDLRPADSTRYDLVAVGENSLDYVARLGPDRPVAGKQRLRGFETFVGGQAATAAVGCARQGHRTSYAGVLGTDAAGQAVRRALSAEFVDLTATSSRDLPNRVAVVLVDVAGERTVYEYRDPGLTPGDSAGVLRLVGEARLLLVDATDLDASIALCRAARAAGVRTVVDVDRVEARTADLLAVIDVIIVPEAFVGEFTGARDVTAGLRALTATTSAAAVVATRGLRGSWAVVGGQVVDTPGFDVPVVDTTGAGDAFRAGFCSAWLRAGLGADPADLLTWANATAALNCRAMGAQTGLPTRLEVAALVTSGRRIRSN